MCLVKIHGEEMPGDVKSMGQKVELQTLMGLRKLSDVEQDTGIAEVTNALCKL